VKVRESIPAPLRLSLSGPGAVHEATLAAREFAESAGIDQADVAHLAVVVEELVTNLYDHGGLGPTDSFEIRLAVRRADTIVVLIAPGEPFDPRGAFASSGTGSRGGGAGLRLARSWSSQIDYQYADGQNHVAVLLPHKNVD